MLAISKWAATGVDLWLVFAKDLAKEHVSALSQIHVNSSVRGSGYLYVAVLSRTERQL